MRKEWILYKKDKDFKLLFFFERKDFKLLNHQIWDKVCFHKQMWLLEAVVQKNKLDRWSK